MARKSKDTVNRPSQSHMEYVNVNGVRKKNLAYKKKKAQRKTPKSKADIRDSGPDRSSKEKQPDPVADKVLNRRNRKERAQEIAGVGPGANIVELDIDGDSAYVDRGGKTFVIHGDKSDFLDSDNFTYSLYDADGNKIVEGDVETTVADAIEDSRVEILKSTYGGVGFLNNVGNDNSRLSNRNAGDYGDAVEYTEGSYYHPTPNEDYHGGDISYTHEPELTKITDRKAFAEDYMEYYQNYWSGSSKGLPASDELIEQLDGIGFYDVDNWEANIEKHYYGDEHYGFKPVESLDKRITELNNKLRDA